MVDTKMREIKFRGFNKFKNKWFYGYPCDKPNVLITEFRFDEKLDEFVCCDANCRQDIFIYEDIEESTLGQFTGIRDKNKKEIYEGDIVKFAVFDLSFDADENVEKFEKRYEKDEIVFANGRFIAGIKYGSNESLALMQELEVVGNIYETSEAE